MPTEEDPPRRSVAADLDPRRPHTIEEFEAVIGKMEHNLDVLLNCAPFGRDGGRPKPPATYGVYLLGELAALRWRDVDWSARVIRVRRSYSRGQWTTPKSRRSSRAVPMADRVARELERHFGRSAYTSDDDLVFCHPHTGTPYDASKSRVRFKAALRRAGLRELRFHDLRHTYGTLMAAAGTPLRTLQGWMGHRDYKTTEIYADFAPDPSQGAVWAQRAFGDAPDSVSDPGTNLGTNLSATGTN